ncbi:MAG: cytochrome c3 family protein [Anaerolineae bacterium]|nr:cytochrome c3 family protein [Anaerolineae bacterium]
MRRLSGLSVRQRLLIGMGGALVGVIIIAALALLVSAQSDAADDQPIAFNHNIHVSKNGMQCQYCHYGAAESPEAVIPSVELCMGCHANIATDRPEIQKLAGYWERQEPIPWKRVNEQPSFVYFAHHPHIAAGVSCGACHGDVARMEIAEPVVNMNMGFCLDCHAEQDNKDALYDCAVCHR